MLFTPPLESIIKAEWALPPLPDHCAINKRTQPLIFPSLKDSLKDIHIETILHREIIFTIKKVNVETEESSRWQYATVHILYSCCTERYKTTRQEQ